jgi:tetratricopeptide (TPR) repeat protein
MSAPRRSRTLILLAGMAMILAPAFGQRGGHSTPPPGGATTSPGGAGQTTSPGQPAPGPNQAIYLTGRVMLDDGTPPPQPVPIQQVCGGSPYTEGYTNSQGDFSVTVGSSYLSNSLQDASSPGLHDPSSGTSSPNTPGGNQQGSNTQRWMNCEIRAQLAGYQSQTVSLLNRRAMDDPNVGTIFLHRLGPSAGTTVSATTLAAPKRARKAYEKALALIKQEKLDAAQVSLAKAVEEYPRYAVAWSQLGKLASAKGDRDKARHAFQQSINADPKYVVPYVEMSLLELRAHRWKEGADSSEKAAKLDPFDYPQAFFFNAVAHYNLHEPAAAEESARRAQRLDTLHQFPQVSRLMGWILAERHDYSGAAAEVRDYLKLAPDARDAADARSQLERLEQLIAANPVQPAP